MGCVVRVSAPGVSKALTEISLLPGPLKAPGAQGHHHGVPVGAGCQRLQWLDGGGLVNDPGIVKQQNGPRLGQGETLTIRPGRIKHTGFTAFDAHPVDHEYRHQIHAIPVRAFGRGPTNAIGARASSGADAVLTSTPTAFTQSSTTASSERASWL